ncbi:MAG: serine hydrolase [Bacteroidota bacterium]
MDFRITPLTTLKLCGILLLLLLWGCKKPHEFSEQVTASAEERIKYGYNPSIVVATIDESGVSFYPFGKTSEDGKLVDEHTIYEIGSITKTFTAILLAKQVVEGKVSLDDPINNYLPDSVKVPYIGDQEITLGHLSDHTSGLPRMPDNFEPADPSNPYVDYSVAQLYDFISHYKPTRSVGSKFEYSNLAQGLLGHILARNEGMTYEELLIRDITGPLGMTETKIVLDDHMKEDMALGHDQEAEVSNWDITTLAGAGGIRSSASDMAKYISANLGLIEVDPTLRAAMDLTYEARHKKAGPNEFGLAWIITAIGNVYWHNGGTGGYRAYAGFSKKFNKGAVVLTNSTEGVDDIGQYLLTSESKLREFKPSLTYTLRKKIDDEGLAVASTFFNMINPEGLMDYEYSEQSLNNLGYHYLMNDKVKIALAVFEMNIELHPRAFNVYDSYAEALAAVGQTELAIENYKISLEKNPNNKNAIEKLADLGVVYEVENVSVFEDVLESYVGRYKLAPRFFIEITREGEHIFGQATNQTRFEMFPIDQTKFYLKVVDAQIEFMTDEDTGKRSMVLYQNGREMPGEKVE